MADDQLDTLLESVYCTTYHFVTGRAGLRERLRAALADLRASTALAGVAPADDFEG
jgi:hypothetical protein